MFFVLSNPTRKKEKITLVVSHIFAILLIYPKKNPQKKTFNRFFIVGPVFYLTPPPLSQTIDKGVLGKYLHKCGAALKELVTLRVSPYKASQGPYWQPQLCDLLRLQWRWSRPSFEQSPYWQDYSLSLPIGETTFVESLLGTLLFKVSFEADHYGFFEVSPLI